ncbi:MAG: class I SAM-dependent methyltransferase [bacterium]|nr:class I SAM-dependent methyltransferase [bacterium]
MTMHFNLSKYWNPVFIETGTRSGDSVKQALKSQFEKIYSIELNERFYEKCRSRFENEIQAGKVELLLGDSAKRLPDILKQVDVRATFWLDAHWSGPKTATAKGDIDVPLVKELDWIARHSINDHTILIDDVRLFDGDDRDGVDWSNVQKEAVISILMNINPDYEIFYEQGHVSNDVLVAQIQR